jgi:hypothetical protein
MAIPLEVEIILEKNVRCLMSEPLNSDNINCDDVGAVATDTISLTAAETVKFGVIGTGNQLPTDAKLNPKANLPFRVGQIVLVEATGGAGTTTNAGVATISEINDNGTGKLTIKFAANINTNTLTGVTMSATNNGVVVDASQTLNYQVKNPRLIVPKIIPAPAFTRAMSAAIAKGQYAMDIVSYTDYQQSINSSTTRSTTIVPADLSRVKSILSVPQELEGIDLLTNMRAQQGRYMSAESYEYQINNRMVPSRLVDLSREDHGTWEAGVYDYINVPSWANGSSLGAVHTYEVEKALQDSGIDVRNLKFLGKTKDDNFSDGYYVIGRTLGPYGMSENLMGVSAILYLNYKTIGAPSLKLLHNYCVHIRTIQLGPGGVSLRY